MKRLSALVGLALLAGLAGASTAEARTATPTTNVNVRSGPGTGHAVIGVLPAGSRVWVGSCAGSWCTVRLGSLAGWASASYLAATYRPPVIVRPPIILPLPHHHYRPGWHPGPKPPGWHPGPKPHFPGHGPKPPMCKPGMPCPK